MKKLVLLLAFFVNFMPYVNNGKLLIHCNSLYAQGYGDEQWEDEFMTDEEWIATSSPDPEAINNYLENLAPGDHVSLEFYQSYIEDTAYETNFGFYDWFWNTGYYDSSGTLTTTGTSYAYTFISLETNITSPPIGGDGNDPCSQVGADPCDCFGIDCDDGSENSEPEPCEGTECPICHGYKQTTSGAMNARGMMKVTTNNSCPACTCPIDCAGVPGGKAYTITCNGQTICVDGNVGMFNNTLTGDKLTQFNEAKNGMLVNCLRTALLNSINSNSGIVVGTSSSTNGSFDPCNYSVNFDPNSNIDTYTLTGELFHAYQDQFMNGKLREIKLDLVNNNYGGCNIEFEEKAMNLIAGKFFGGLSELGGCAKLEIWCETFLTNHPIHSNIILTQQEIDSWFESMEEFRNYYINQGFKNLYVKPIDYNMLPVSLLSLWSQSICEYQK